MEIKIKYDDKAFQEAEANLRRIEDVVVRKEVLVKALNDTARGLVNSHKNRIVEFVDRPKKFTINSLFAWFANKSRLDASVEYKARVHKKILKQHWLAPLVFGGTRSDKGLDIALHAFRVMPADYQAIPMPDVQTDGYGNVAPGLVKQIISFLRVDLSDTQNRTRRSVNAGQRRREVKRKARFFVVAVGSVNNLSPGIYEYRAMFGGRAVRKVFSFHRKAIYQRKFPFFEESMKYVSTFFPTRVEERVRDYFVGGRK